MEYRCQYCGRKLDTGLRCQVCDAKRSESMEKNKNCSNCIYYEVDEMNTYDKSNPRGVCHALPSIAIIRHRVIPCIYYKEKDN